MTERQHRATGVRWRTVERGRKVADSSGICVDCGAPFTTLKGRGRPRIRCDACNPPKGDLKLNRLDSMSGNALMLDTVTFRQWSEIHHYDPLARVYREEG